MRNQEILIVGEGSIEVSGLLRKGEKLTQLFSHSGFNGNLHKGNFKVAEILVDADDNGDYGFEAKAQCVMKGCDATVRVKTKRSNRK